MRTEEDINKGMHIFCTDDKIIAVQDNYSHSLGRIESSLNYLKQFVKIPDNKEEI